MIRDIYTGRYIGWLNEQKRPHCNLCINRFMKSQQVLKRKVYVIHAETAVIYYLNIYGARNNGKIRIDI